MAKVAASIQAFGFRQPIVVDEKGTIIVGHTRLLAALHLGLKEVPVHVAHGLTEAQVKAYRLADNRTAEEAEWDVDLLAGEFADLTAARFDLALTGFEPIEWAEKSGGLLPGVDPDAAPDLPKHPVTVVGDLLLLGPHRVLCGDCGDVAQMDRLMDGEMVDILVTSPPYNQRIDGFAPSGMHKEGQWVEKVARLAYADSMDESDYQAWQKELLVLWFAYVREGGSLFYNHKNRYREKRVLSPLQWLPEPFTLRQEIIWSRPGSVTQNARMFLPSDERIYWLYKGEDFYFDDTTEIKSWSTVWDINLETNKTHAVAFPFELPRRCIVACSKPGAVVLDPFAGSGTTLIAAEAEGRQARLMELSPAYCDVIVARWEQATGQKAVRPQAAA